MTVIKKLEAVAGVDNKTSAIKFGSPHNKIY
jgi:hypothetical protein